MEADSYTLHFQIYASAMTSTADPTGSEREDKKESKKERIWRDTKFKKYCLEEAKRNKA